MRDFLVDGEQVQQSQKEPMNFGIFKSAEKVTAEIQVSKVLQFKQ